MGKVGKIYKRNIYGVMGTLIFHILLVSLFLLAEIDMKGKVKEEELIIEFPDILPELEESVEEELEQQQDIINEPSLQNTETNNRITNAASNRLASNEDFFDEEYLKEIEAAKKLVSTVNNQLSKEIIDLEDIKMPVETTEGMDPDSIKNIIYTGESNIVYYLENRYHLSLPIPVYLAQGGGKVIVDILVNQNGVVVQATTRKNPAIRDQQIFLLAQLAASKTIFNTDLNSPLQQKGTIHYTFVAQ
ncbi:MAG: hypothetical protein HN778_02120 [Prolixibacteraceae bacterium]|jgi:hypothetical protein|nr:hypothetical protein [Prolixibacteraceae bacterium]MBT6005290.1 hypothetical protein [Prolixibacteraceae bacterium]MBT6763800.1 hypothetical protein [Prolixibacteraceae bacterium]MBT7000371.1 hypothetical protein [Prolixibacteraceae bacterium]MBT7393607.1 hypothetical protein [Prolixibacteraceae bacterium]